MHRQRGPVMKVMKQRNWLLTALIAAALLAAISWYLLQFQHSLPYNHAASPAGTPYFTWLIPVLGSFILFTAALFTSLLVEIRLHKKIIEALTAQRDHYRSIVHSKTAGPATAAHIDGLHPAISAAGEALYPPQKKVYTGIHAPVELATAALAGQTASTQPSAPRWPADSQLHGAATVVNSSRPAGRPAEAHLPLDEISFKAVIEHLPEAVFTCDAEAHIRLYNKAAAALWGRLPAAGEALWTGSWKILSPQGKPLAAADCPLTLAIKQQRPLRGQEIAVQRMDGSLQYFLVHSSPVFDAAGRTAGAVNVLTDITERKKAALDTLQTAERYDILLKATSDTIWDWDIVNNRMMYNSGITKMFGYQITEIADIFNWWRQNIHPDDLQLVMDAYFGPVQDARAHIQQEYRFRCADGSYKYIYDRAFILYDAQQRPVRVIGSMQDISYQKEAEKIFSKGVIDAQENERRHIGEELHDNVNQLLASAMLTLGMVSHYRNNPDEMIEFAEKAKQYTHTALNEIRKLSHNLAPASGVENALKNIIENLLQGINLKNQFNIVFHFDERVNTLLPQDTQVNLYRILQEQVKNILQYAEASTIKVELAVAGGKVILTTTDNGKGFDPKKTKQGIGLSNIKRRVESLAGKMLITAAPGNGCAITIEVPCTPA